MKCIICLNEKPESEFSQEHVFPEAIGGSYIVNSVCTECNSQLGMDVDVHLTDNRLVVMQRHIHRIRNKKGEVPNSLSDGVLEGPNGQKVYYLMDGNGNPASVYCVPKVERVKCEEGYEQVNIVIDELDRAKLPEIVNKIRKRSGLPELTEEETADLLCSETHTIEDPVIHQTISMNIIEYKRAILKIAYELSVHWLGDRYLNDPISKLIRECMLDKNLPIDFSAKYPIHGTIDYCGEGPKLKLWEDEPESHISYLTKNGKDIICYVRIFNIIEGSIKVSHSSNLYPDFNGKFLAVNSVSGQVRESDYLTEIKRYAGSFSENTQGRLAESRSEIQQS